MSLTAIRVSAICSWSGRGEVGDDNHVMLPSPYGPTNILVREGQGERDKIKTKMSVIPGNTHSKCFEAGRTLSRDDFYT